LAFVGFFFDDVIPLEIAVADCESSVFLRRQLARQLGQAQADLQTARLNLGYAEIPSPISGYVGNRAARVGAYVSQGTYLLTIVPAHGVWVDANFKEDQLARMQPGQSANIVADTA
jgi:membrane fusion protein, multidrug efflux system